jgi:alpha-mannosidase
MHDDREVVEERISRELTERVLPLVHPERQPLAVEAGPSLTELQPFSVGDRWGPPWGTTWFRFTGEVPAGWSGGRVEALIDVGFRLDSPGFQCEGLVRDSEGQPVQGIHPRRTAVPVASEPGTVSLIVEAASNPAFPQFRPSPMGSPETAGDRPLYRLDRAELVVVDPEAEALVLDLTVLDGVMRTLALTDPRRPRLRRTIERALDLLVAPDRDVTAARVALRDALDTPAAAGSHRVVATGHAHIDTAWLWPLSESIRKCVRTYASAVALMDADPDYRFSCSSAQHYAWIEEHEPKLFARIAEKVAAGQWVPVGGMWVEADTNMPSGESLVRQFVHGQRWFEEHFGLRCTEAWIPDVFGYPAGLPQLFTAAGIRRFVTQKLSWNRTNRFPHHTFWWEGFDGSRVLTHFPPVDTYNAEMTPAELAHATAGFRDHGWSGWSLLPFGYGDGGGGPTREMLAQARRMADLDGMPQVELGPPARFFDAVEAEAARGAPVPVWRGELYLETHRGTLTSQLRTKLGNRRCERLLREAELWMASGADPGDPHELDGLWREVLTRQFHDILPGSSIAWVHEEAEAAFERVAGELETRVGARLRELAPPGPVLANAATHARDEVVVATVAPGGGGPVQELDGGRTAFRSRVPGLGLARAEALPIDERVVVTDRSMANGRLAVAWDLDGRLRSVIDVARARELLPERAFAADLELAADQPVQYDAWDLEAWTRRRAVAVTEASSLDVVASGPLVGMVRVERRFGPSSAVLTYTLRAGSPRLDIHVELDWRHDEHLLSLAFPLDVVAETATCGIQFGAVRRPTHRSTSWDAAKFEVCAHRYVDVAEPSFGVAVLNDGRYGHSVFDGAVRVSLARAAKYPDPGADHGRHEVTVSLLPHGPGLADVVAEAEALDRPLRVVDGGTAVEPAPPVVEVTGPGVEVDAVKPADDGSGDLVVRLHEACGDRARVSVRTDGRIVAASRCNLLEEPGEGFEVSDGILALTLRPFELVTLRLTRS